MKAKVYLVISLLLLMAACSDESKQQAKETLDSATETGKQLYSEAKEKAGEISAEITGKSKDLDEAAGQQAADITDEAEAEEKAKELVGEGQQKLSE
ncbi:MAG: hypothetical protein ABFS45_15735 [Pseudomonadota bacterium]